MIRKTHTIGIMALAYLFFAGSVLLWILYEVTTTGDSLLQNVEVIANTNAKEKVFNDLSDLLKETQDDRESLKYFMLVEDETSSFLTDIEHIGASQGAAVTTNSLKVVEKEGSYNELIVNFGLEGSEDSVLKMLTVFETLPYQSQVMSLDLQRASGNETSAMVELLISLMKHER